MPTSVGACCSVRLGPSNLGFRGSTKHPLKLCMAVRTFCACIVCIRLPLWRSVKDFSNYGMYLQGVAWRVLGVHGTDVVFHSMLVTGAGRVSRLKGASCA